MFARLSQRLRRRHPHPANILVRRLTGTDRETLLVEAKAAPVTLFDLSHSILLRDRLQSPTLKPCRWDAKC